MLVLNSCEKWYSTFGAIDWCSLRGRDLTNAELSIINNSPGDTLFLEDDTKLVYFIRCSSNVQYRYNASKYDYHCDDDSSFTSYDIKSAEFATNIPNADSSYLRFKFFINTNPRFVDGNEPIPESYFGINYYTRVDSQRQFFWYATTPNSNKIIKNPFEFPYKYNDEECKQRFFINYKEVEVINDKTFNDVFIFSLREDYDSNNNHATDYIDTIIYQSDYGILGLYYRETRYSYKSFKKAE